MITIAYVAALVLLAVGGALVLAGMWMSDDGDDDAERAEWSRWN